jgi:signal transduction protein with GAF and PtsI domain
MINLLNRTEDSSESIILTDVKGINTTRSKDAMVEKILSGLQDSGDDLQKLANNLLIRIAREKEIIQGLFLLYDGKSKLNFLSSYAYNNEKIDNLSFKVGEGLPGQVALDRKIINLKKVPEGYIIVKTGLGQASPNALLIFPVIYNEILIGVIELASFKSFSSDDESIFIDLSQKIGEKIAKYSIRES